VLNRYPGGSVYKGTVPMIRGECQGIYDRLTGIAVDFADAGEQSLFPWNSLLCRRGRVYVIVQIFRWIYRNSWIYKAIRAILVV